MALSFPGETLYSVRKLQEIISAALDDRDLEINIREREPRDLHEAYVPAERYESYRTASERPDCSNDQSPFDNRRIQTEKTVVRRSTAF